MAASRKSILVRMPAPLKRALAREVARRHETMNDVAVGLLAVRFDVPFEPSGRRGASAPGASGAVLLRVSPELKSALRAEAERSASTVNQLVVDTLSAELRGKEPMAQQNGNGRARSQDKVRVAIIGVGNCANSLLQGVEYYKDA
ncbi:MAG TPA: toxin-antitoxin system HicB family antitoxin, partial [Gaiellaceae bacterium]